MQLTFADMLDDAAMLSLEHQLYLGDLLGADHRWSVDLGEPKLELTGDRTLVCRQIHLLGTAAPGPRSWLWSWANPGAYPAALTGLAAALAEFGRGYGIAELANPEVPFTALPGPTAQPHEAVGLMMDAAKAFSGRWFSYNGDAGGGTRAAFLIEHPELVLPAPDPARVMRVINQSIGQAVLRDHRRALQSYATKRPLGAVFNADYTQLSITGPRMKIHISFDLYGRVAEVTGDLG